MRAIDMHTHVATPEALGEMSEMAAHFGTDLSGEPMSATAAQYRALDMLAIVFMVDRQTRGVPYLGNDYLADQIRPFRDTLIGFASVDPWKGADAVREVRHAIVELDLKGVKFMPLTQQFYPDNRAFYPLWEEIASLAVPIVVHTGTTGVGAGTPGGSGVSLDFGRPIPHLDAVARDFPTLQIVAAHPGWPWHDELLAVMVHKSNVWMDLSGWSPRYLPPSVIQYANTLLQDRILFGTDYPLLTPERWLRDFEQVAIRDHVRPKILLENAARLLGLSSGGARSMPGQPLAGEQHARGNHEA